MATKQMSARKIVLGLGGLVILSLLSVGQLRAQDACLPTDKAEIERIDRYIQELQTDSARLTAFLDKVLQHPQYSVIIEPIIASAAQRLENPGDADKEANVLLTDADWARIKEIVCMLLRSPGTTPAQTIPTPPSQPQTPAEPVVKIWFDGDQKYYGNGEVIEIPYFSGKSLVVFGLHDHPATTKKIKWTITENFSDITYNVATRVTDEPLFPMNIGGRDGKILVKAVYDDKEIVVELKMLKEKFSLVDASASPEGKVKRVAKGGQTLYLVNGDHTPGSVSRETVQVNYTSTISPNLSADKFGVTEVEWHYKDQTQFQNNLVFQGKNFSRLIKEEDAPIVTSITAGYPTAKSKQITVKWVDGTIKSFAFVPPAVSATLTKVFKQTEKGLEVLDWVLLKIGDGKKAVEIKVEPIKMTGKLFNQEDSKSRLYREVKSGSLSAGIKAKVYEKKFTHPALKALEKIKVADAALYITGEVGVTAAGGVDIQKYVESAKETGTQPFIDVGVKGCIEVGAVAKLLVAKEYIDFELKAYGQACLSGSWKWTFGQDGEGKGKLSIPPMVVGLKAKIKTKDPLNFELVDYNGSFSVLDEIVLYP